MIDVSKAPHLPGSREITPREIAMGALSKPLYRGDYSEIRYMDNNDKVSFKVLNRKSDFNWEFYVNGDTTHKIWFSQLNGIYMFREGTDLYGGVLSLKGQKPKLMALISPNEFWNMVQGKRFNVTIETDKFVIDFWHPHCQGKNAGDLAKEIDKALNEKRYDYVKGMTKPRTLYHLTEI